MAGNKDMYLVWIQGFVHFSLKEEEVPRGEEDFSPRDRRGKGSSVIKRAEILHYKNHICQNAW